MDVSKEYILMCSKAEEIQKTRFDYSVKERENISLEVGDYCSAGDEAYLVIKTSERGNDAQLTTDALDLKKGWHQEHWFRNYGLIWLPRQDQLQEMVTEQTTSTYALSEKFFSFVKDNWQSIWETLPQHPSFEQLWLAFVMSEKYGKVFNGNEWVKR